MDILIPKRVDGMQHNIIQYKYMVYEHLKFYKIREK